MFGVCFSFCLYSIDFGWFVYFSFKKLFVKAFLLTSVRELVLCRHRTTKTFRGKLTLYWNRLTSYKKYTITSTATSKIVFLNTVSISVFAALLQFFYKANSNKEGTLIYSTTSLSLPLLLSSVWSCQRWTFSVSECPQSCTQRNKHKHTPHTTRKHVCILWHSVTTIKFANMSLTCSFFTVWTKWTLMQKSMDFLATVNFIDT